MGARTQVSKTAEYSLSGVNIIDLTSYCKSTILNIIPGETWCVSPGKLKIVAFHLLLRVEFGRKCPRRIQLGPSRPKSCGASNPSFLCRPKHRGHISACGFQPCGKKSGFDRAIRSGTALRQREALPLLRLSLIHISSMQPPPPAKESGFDAGKYSLRTSCIHCRAVRLVAGLARQPRRVVCRNHLRKALWFSCAGRMTAGAQHCRVGKNRCHCGWIVGMFFQRPVASFAVHVRMFALRFHVQNIRMAALAGLVASKLDAVSYTHLQAQQAFA